MIDDKSDAMLLQEFRRGDADAFPVFVRRHQDAIYRLALRNLGDPGSARWARNRGLRIGPSRPRLKRKALSTASALATPLSTRSIASRNNAARSLLTLQNPK
ncbi:MAG: hypothetical protein V2I56_25050 [Desulfobacteraceae bacterium]|nr:hypothetical protein [Desulfobacteraceae bacterium]